ncbi:tRNA (adenosine(37)-N6)-dimethylallyltransferase MiaA [Psychroflexus aestuariivivens]|uniref:tRNA (adenosine(37)-N6)-dimethylallyltransferase MiaA n=1 Tax=Psychroflexus aestuariivivens TaxID=1795040 RepID=UPI000FD99F76|nr:tRNA (adenosine(37)-N6)-dimethylallyltransferase MiaA [Psychroflexus aestuariivivens]
MTKKLISIIGPTAIGKTSKSIALAKIYNTEILSCDSRQFYKEMSIGTAVPEDSEMAEIPHHFIQHRSIIENYNVGDFEKDAIKKLSEIFLENNIAIMVGGSGLYEKAVVEGLDQFPDIDPKVRENLNTILKHYGIEKLQNELAEKDPEYYTTIDQENPRRIIRALEVILSSGEKFSKFLNQPKPKRSFETIKIGLDAPRQIIYERINQRVDLMIENGLVDEAKSLYKHKSLNALNTVGYKELFRFFEDEITLEEAISEIKKNTRRFAKRQMTWFKKDEDIRWFPYETSAKEISEFINKKHLS